MKKIYLLLNPFSPSFLQTEPEARIIQEPSELRSRDRLAVADQIMSQRKVSKKSGDPIFSITNISVTEMQIILEGLTHLKNNLFKDNEHFVTELLGLTRQD
jgi:hypothetical protein